MRPGAVTVVALEPDDRLSVVDVQGGQIAEVTVLSPEGAEDFARAGAAPGRSGVRAPLARRHHRRRRSRADRTGRRRWLRPDARVGRRALRLVVLPGASEAFRAERACVVAVGSPGSTVSRSSREAYPPPTCCWRSSARMPRGDAEARLPDPLADPRLDFEVARSSALAYEVKAGEYIQIIDVRGRQCSDFLAFDTAELDAGRERGLDSTATRTLMGSAYPQPGLFSKFFTCDLKPLVEVVRDTVGRHDTFGLACTAKYYEDMGYFGHVNCSENFNAELLPYTIEAAQGLAGDQLLLQHRDRRAQRCTSQTRAGRDRGTTCCSAPRPTWSACRAPARTTSTRPTAGTRPRSTSASTRPRSGSPPRSPTASRPTPSRS